MKILILTFFLCCVMIAHAQTCDPYIPHSPCNVEVNFASGEHDIIAVPPGGAATIHVTHIAPLSSCQAAYSPGPLTRTLDTSIAGLLTTLGGLGAVAGGAPRALPAAVPAPTLAPLPGLSDSNKIVDQIRALDAEEKRIAGTLTALRKPYQDASDALSAFRKLTDEPTQAQLVAVADKLKVVEKPIPSFAGLQAELDSVGRALAAFHEKYDGAPDPGSMRTNWLAAADDAFNLVAGAIARDQDYISDIPAFWTALKQTQGTINSALDHFKPLDPGPVVYFTSQSLPVTPKFYNSNVSVTITCKDTITQTPSQITITFTAYYTRLPILDLSAGPLFSLLGRRQVGTVSPSAAVALANPMAPGTLAVTDSSSFQVIPMAFVEIHARGFKCPWATAGDRERRFGYVCSAGIALGAGPNNGSGTTEAEFFEGASFAIQRVSFLFGFHDGRIEQLAGGNTLGQMVPSGYTPLITRGWSVRPAFGITYRIPIH